MFLSVDPPSEFLRVVQIVCWIVLPVLVTTIALTIYVHYRKVKKNRAGALSAEEMLPVPATLAQLNTDADYILFDHTGLVKQYHQKLCHSQAMYAALQQKVAALEVKCAAMAAFVSGQTDAGNQINSYPQLKREVDRFIKKSNAKKKEWEAINEQLAYTCSNLQKENQSLRKQLEAMATQSPSLIVASATEPQQLTA